MRKLILDTETTGLDYQKDRIIELACLEVIDNEYTDRKFHQYYNPDGVVISDASGLAIPVTVLVTPGPAVTIAIPTFPVKYE